MKRRLIKILGASMFLVLVSGTTAVAQLFEGSLHANIPFRFYAGDTWLPPGKYIIRVADSEDPQVLLIRNEDDTVEVLLATEATTKPEAPQTASLDFERVGTKDFLSAVWVEGSKTGFEVPEPRLEKKLIKAALKKGKHSVTAYHSKP